MSESLIETKRRINTIESTKKITKAMKLVSSVKYQRLKKGYEDNKNYFLSMRHVMVKTVSSLNMSSFSHTEYLKHYDSNKTLYIVVSSTLGLCGSYNYSIFKLLDPILKENDELVIIGNKGHIHYKNTNYKIYGEFISIFDNYDYDTVKTLRHFLFRKHRQNEYKEIKLVYTHYKNSMSFIPEMLTIAPLDIEDLKAEADLNSYPPIFEPNNVEVADLIFPHYVDSLLYHKLLESALSEQASRRNAMESATDNAEDLLDDLKITYNKSRQSLITQEITEVVAGSNASK